MKKCIIVFLLIIFVIIVLVNGSVANASTITLANKAISLSQGTSWNTRVSGVYKTNNHEYRYVGPNVDNWIRFNDDDYRIIGVFDSNSTGVNGNLVKVIRSRAISSNSWGAVNNPSDYSTYLKYEASWSTSNVNVLLNEYFLNATDTSTVYGQCSDWTYYYSGNDKKTKNCGDIKKYGIHTTEIRNYIQPVTWYLKGYSAYSSSKQNFYTCERSDNNVISGCEPGTADNPITKVENTSVGLMYVSDLLYATSYYTGADTTISNNGKNRFFETYNWLYNGREWTITPVNSSFSRVFTTNSEEEYTLDSYNIRPTFYLKANVMYESGTGSFSDPYIISCDDCNS